ncbi:MAG: hypothetical protein ACRDNZ_19765, partial [Streptosporangiaceae bacterium]
LALRQLLASSGAGPPELVSDSVILVCPENFSSKPIAAELDVRKQLTVLSRQLSRLGRIDDLIGQLPAGLTFDLNLDSAGIPARPAVDLTRALGSVPARYLPECLASCEMCYFCRAECRGTTTALGQVVCDDLGGMEYVTTALRLASGDLEPAAEDAEVAAMLMTAMQLRAQSLGGAV